MSISLISIFPGLLGTYGDAGNVLALKYQAKLHDLDLEVVDVTPGDPIPRNGDLYVLGGGEDNSQTAACQAMVSDGGLNVAAERGAAVLAICAGYQLLGEYFPGPHGERVPGLGILDIRTERMPERAVGELVARPRGLRLPTLTGYENHGGATTVGADAEPLADVVTGVGNGDGTEGAISGHMIGTYLHGPGLARNPALADLLLSWCVGEELPQLDQPEIEDLRQERLRASQGLTKSRLAMESKFG